MKHLLLLAPLFLTASAVSTAAAQDVVVSGEKQAPAEETRAVTLDVTGMTWASGWTPQVRKALESLPCVRKATIDFANKQVTATVVSKSYDEKALLKALKDAGFGGSVAKASNEKKNSAKAPDGAQVAYRVSGMKKTKSGATWVGWPDKVTEALVGTHATHAVTWNYKTDTVTITYDAKKTDPEKLAKVIQGLEYGTEQVAVEKPAAMQGFKSYKAPLPKDAPAEFAQAFNAAREAGKPIIIDFWATWCAPCVKLKKLTLDDPVVAKALEGVEVILVDLDKHPELAKSFGVMSVPDVFFIDARGDVTDRLKAFEEPKPFLERIGKWLAPKKKAAALGLKTKIPSEETTKALGLKNKVRVLGREVSALEPDGAAVRAGLKVGDVVLRLGSNDLYSTDDIADFLSVASQGDRVPVVLKRAGEAEQVGLVATLDGESAAVSETPGIEWQYASLGQLPLALKEARAKKKKVLVGLSGAETWWPTTRFESGALSTMLNDPEVVRASEEFVRIIIRRPHAYFVLDEWFKDQGGCVSATPEGMVLGDGGTVPLPGLYVLTAEGVVVTSAGLVGEDARSTLLKALRIE